jgi:hypothetical protein
MIQSFSLDRTDKAIPDLQEALRLDPSIQDAKGLLNDMGATSQ